MADNLNAIKNLENKYGLALFRMALTYLVDVGIQHLTDDAVAESIKQITAKDAEIKANGVHSAMGLDFQIGIISCAAELAKFQIMDLFLYIKKHVHISNK